MNDNNKTRDYCQKHKNEITMVNTEKDINIINQDRLLCDCCYQDIKVEFKNINVNTAKENIKNFKQIEKQWIQDCIYQAKQFQFTIQDYQNEVGNLINTIKNYNQDRIDQLYKQLNQYDEINLLQDLNYLINDMNVDETFKQLDKLNSQYQSLILQQLKQFKDISNQFTEETFQIKKQEDINYKFESYGEIPQNYNTCYAIAFNKDDTIVASAQDNKINLWKLDTNLELDQIDLLPGHKYKVCCLLFSKKHNWLISADYSEKIISWKENSNNTWDRQESCINQSYEFNCVILNKRENELIASTIDGSLIIFKASYENNKIELNYKLENIHTQGIGSIQLNQLNTLLISSSSNQINIYNQEDNKWHNQQYINCKSQGFRLCFISNNEFICQYREENTINIIELSNTQYFNKVSLKLEESISRKDEHNYFPPKFIQKKNILIYKNQQGIYLIQKQVNGNIKLEDKIIYDTSEIFGEISNNGEIVIVWNSEKKCFQIIKIIKIEN